MASSLVERGFKVARVEQTETPEMMAERCKGKKSGKFDKVVSREICQISELGTCVYGAQMQEAKRAAPYYMLALTEKVGWCKKKDIHVILTRLVLQKQKGTKHRFGVCFVDVSIGTFHLAEFDDDEHCSCLLALFAEHTPSLVRTPHICSLSLTIHTFQILIERGALTTTTLDILKRQYGNVKRESLSSGSQFYTASNTLAKLGSECYFKNKNGQVEWPALFDKLKDGSSIKTSTLNIYYACLFFSF